MNREWVQAIVTILFGSITAGATNYLAVWMLLHPYEPPTLFGRRLRFLQGAIPKNRARLAKAVGKTVGERLLTQEDLTDLLAREEFRAAFDERLAVLFSSLLEKERGTLRELLPPSTALRAEELLGEGSAFAMDRLFDWLDSEAFATMVRGRTREWFATLEGESIGEVLTPDRGTALAETLERWLSGLTAEPEVRRTIEGYLERASHRILEPGRSFEELLPKGLVHALERTVAGYLPLAIARLSRLLEDPEVRSRFESVLQSMLRRFLQDLRFHQRLVARVLVREDAVDRVLDAIRDEGAARISSMLQEEEMQRAIAEGVRDAIADLLRRPVVSVIGGPEDESVREARATVADWILGAASDPGTRAFVAERIEDALSRAGARNWGELLDRIGEERGSDWLIGVVRSAPVRAILRSLGSRAPGALLDHRIGRPDRFLPRHATGEIRGLVADPLWEWIKLQVPEIIRRIDISRRVEEKVLEFPTEKLEELILRVSERELKMIVRLGFLLGAIVGGVLVVTNRLMGGALTG